MTGMKAVKTAFNRPFKKEEKRMEKDILEALQEMTGEACDTMEQATGTPHQGGTAGLLDAV